MLSKIILESMEKIERIYHAGDDRWNALKAHLKSCENASKGELKMNRRRALELLEPLTNGKARDISPAWRTRMIEALEYVIEHDKGANS